MSEDDNAAFVRWQAITIEQLTYGINLLLGLSTASIGFELALFLSKDFAPTRAQGFLMTASLWLLAISTGFGIWCTINRLKDFRATKKVAELKHKKAPESEIKVWREKCDRAGKCTWELFWAQITAFGLGMLMSVIVASGLIIGKIP